MKKLISSIFGCLYIMCLSVQGLTHTPTLPTPPFNESYCESFGIHTTYEYINKVSIGDEEFHSGDNSGYADYTNIHIEIIQEEDYRIQLIPGHTSVPSIEAWTIWIDSNQNGIFEEAELLLTERSNQTIEYTFSIGRDVTLGLTRLRISMQYNMPAGPCDIVSFGEVEDYAIDIIPNCAKQEGKICDDANPCTINDTYNGQCECIGFEIGDSDNDGICDVMDECPGTNDQLIGQPCDDGMDCTEEDVFTFDCKCEGRYIDLDEDGYCKNEDPDDTNACIPDFTKCETPCKPESNQFEVGYEAWTDGGEDCTRVLEYSSSGSYSIRLRDNSGVASSLTSPLMYLSAATEVEIRFSYYPHSMEEGESFSLEISEDNGESFIILKTWESDVHFKNNYRYEESLVLDPSIIGNSTLIRWRCNASSNGDQVYLDDIEINFCDYMTQNQIKLTENNHQINSSNETNNSKDYQIEKRYTSTHNEQQFIIYPNPANQYIKIKLKDNSTIQSNTKISIVNIDGSATDQVSYKTKNKNEVTIDISNLIPGMYLISIADLSGYVETKKIIIAQ